MATITEAELMKLSTAKDILSTVSASTTLVDFEMALKVLTAKKAELDALKLNPIITIDAVKFKEFEDAILEMQRKVDSLSQYKEINELISLLEAKAAGTPATTDELAKALKLMKAAMEKGSKAPVVPITPVTPPNPHAAAYPELAEDLGFDQDKVEGGKLHKASGRKLLLQRTKDFGHKTLSGLWPVKFVSTHVGDDKAERKAVFDQEGAIKDLFRLLDLGQQGITFRRGIGGGGIGSEWDLQIVLQKLAVEPTGLKALDEKSREALIVTANIFAELNGAQAQLKPEFQIAATNTNLKGKVEKALKIIDGTDKGLDPNHQVSVKNYFKTNKKTLFEGFVLDGKVVAPSPANAVETAIGKTHLDFAKLFDSAIAVNTLDKPQMIALLQYAASEGGVSLKALTGDTVSDALLAELKTELSSLNQADVKAWFAAKEARLKDMLAFVDRKPALSEFPTQAERQQKLVEMQTAFNEVKAEVDVLKLTPTTALTQFHSTEHTKWLGALKNKLSIVLDAASTDVAFNAQIVAFGKADLVRFKNYVREYLLQELADPAVIDPITKAAVEKLLRFVKS